MLYLVCHSWNADAFNHAELASCQRVLLIARPIDGSKRKVLSHVVTNYAVSVFFSRDDRLIDLELHIGTCDFFRCGFFPGKLRNALGPFVEHKLKELRAKLRNTSITPDLD